MHTPPDWRAYLPALHGFPLLPCGAGTEGKAPINPDTGAPATGWEKAAATPQQIAALNGKVRCVGTRCGPDAGGLLVFDLDGATAIEHAMRVGCDPFTAPTWQIVRNTATDRLKVAFRVPPDLWTHLKGKAKLTTKRKGDDGSKGEQIELFWSTGQVVVLGQHLESGGFYYWPEHHTPAELTEITPEWWGLAQSITEPPTAAPSGATQPSFSPPRHTDPVPLEKLLSRSLEQLFHSGAGEGSRDDDTFRIAVGLITAYEGALAAGLPTTGDPDRLTLDFAARCHPPFPEREAQQKLASARRQPRTPDPNLRQRLAFWSNGGAPPGGPSAASGCPSGGDAGPEADDPSAAPQRRRSELLDAALDAAESGDQDTYAEVQAELMGRFRMTGSQVQSGLFRLLSQRRGGNTHQRPGFVDVATVEHLDHLVPGFVAAHEQTLLHAPKGTGKTLAALAIARAVVTGSPLLDQGTPSTPGRVLYLATDSGCASMHTQMQELGLLEHPAFQHGHPDQAFFIRGHDATQGISAWEATVDEILWLITAIERQRFDLVIIDSAKACLSLTDVDYTDNKAVGALLTLFQRVVCPRCAVLWLHHDGRESGHNAGAKAWAEIPVIVHRLERVQDQPTRPRHRGAPGPDDDEENKPPVGARKWICGKSRIPGDERDFHYLLTPTGDLQVAADVEVVGNCRDAVLQVLLLAHQCGEESLSWTELASRVMSRHGRSTKTVKNTISKMARGREPDLSRPSQGSYAIRPELLEELLSYRGVNLKDWDLGEISSDSKGSGRSQSGPNEVPIAKGLGSYRRTTGEQGSPNASAVGTGLGPGWDRPEAASQQAGPPKVPTSPHTPPKAEITPTVPTVPDETASGPVPLPVGSTDPAGNASASADAQAPRTPLFSTGQRVVVFSGDLDLPGVILSAPTTVTGAYRVQLDDGAIVEKAEGWLTLEAA
jgi:hypothetical protein